MHRSEMFLFVTFLCFFACTCSARPNNFDAPKNMITAPTNCPTGQEWVNGQCREVWRSVTEPNFDFSNLITVPTNCPEGQQFVNGECRDVWRRYAEAPSSYAFGPHNVVTVPTNCPEGQQFVNGLGCREVWRSGNQFGNYINSLRNQLNDNNNNNVISVPNQCPAGYKPDALGICREIM